MVKNLVVSFKIYFPFIDFFNDSQIFCFREYIQIILYY